MKYIKYFNDDKYIFLISLIIDLFFFNLKYNQKQ